MDIYKKILKFSGYVYNNGDNIHPEPLNIDYGKNNIFVARHIKGKNNKCDIRILYKVYNLLICLLMLWPVVYGLYLSIVKSEFSDFGRTWFQIIYVVLYYYGICYFNKNHFYENIVVNSKLMEFVKLYIPLTSILCIVLTLINVLSITIFDSYLHIYTDIYDMSNSIQKVFVVILLILESIYSYQTFTINACIFVVNMRYHRNSVSEYKKNLSEYIKNSMSTIRKLNIIAIEYSLMKDKFDQTVELLTPFFSFLNFLGFLTLYFYFNVDDITNSEIINIILFLLVDVIYVDSIQKMYSNISGISDIIGSTSVIATFFGNKKNIVSNLNTMKVKVNKNQNEVVIHPPSKIDNEVVIHPPSKIDNDVVIHPPSKINNNVVIHPPSKINNDDNNKQENNNENKENNISSDDNISKGYEYDNDIAMEQMLQSSISTDQMIDWLILQGIVGERWRTFRIYGVEFTNTAILSKLFGIVIAYLISSEIIGFIQW
jgi:hypothetical protein